MTDIRLLFLGLILSAQIYSQDQIIYLDGVEDYVDEIVNIQNDSLVYVSFKKTKKAPLSEVKGYCITIDTKENLKKGYYKREREYFAIDSVYHSEYYNKNKKEKHNITDYILTILPENFSELEYAKGYYITKSLDTVYTLISRFKSRENNNVVFISKDDSSNYEVFTPLKVKGYSINDIFYLSYIIDQEDDTDIYMFICQEISGRINLYVKPDLPYHEGSYYLVNKNGSDIFYKVCPEISFTPYERDGYEKTLVSGGPYQSPQYVYKATEQNLDNSFKELMPKLVNDCVIVANKIRNEFYTKSDIIQILKEYNDCDNNIN